MKTKKPLRSNEIGAIRKTIADKTGVNLKSYLIEQAFTRSSYSKRYGGGNNENFEYIGDTILGFCVVQILFKHYGTIHSDDEECIYTFRAHEKDFTTLKSRLVSNHTLAEIIDEWDLCQYLIVGQSDIDNEIDKQEKIKADLLEAIIGAIAVQTQWNTERMAEVISSILPIEQYILDYEKTQYRPPEFSAENAVNTLKELAEHERCSVPQYETDGPENLGYNKNGDPIWACHCTVQNYGLSKVVFAHSKKDAKKYAAYLILCDIFEMPNEYGPSKNLSCWQWDGKRLDINTSREF